MERRSAISVDDSLRRLRMLIVVGKGGVGKTTVAAAAANRAATLGRRVLLVDVEGKNELARLVGGDRLTARPTVQCTITSPRDEPPVTIDACTVAPDTALVEYLDDHGMRQLSKRLVSSGAVDVIATAAPGIKDLLVLGRIKSLVNSGDYDLVIVDTPASGHAVSFLLGPRTLANLADSGSIRRQADEVMDILTSETCEAILVTLPEETPVNETLETAAALRENVGVRIGFVVVNGLLANVPNSPPELLNRLPVSEREAVAAALTFERSRLLRQREQVRRLAESLDVAQVSLPLRPSTRLDLDDVGALAAALGSAELRQAMPT